MANPISRHSKRRIIQRVDGVSNCMEAKKLAKTAYRCGYTIGQLQSRNPALYEYLIEKPRHNNDRCKIYKDNIYIWAGSQRRLVTVYPVPSKFKEVIDT